MAWGASPFGQGFRLHIRPPLNKLKGATVDRAQQINSEIEVLIRGVPSQYLWGYNRINILVALGCL